MSAPERSRASTITVARASAGDQPVSGGKPPGRRLRPRRILGDDQTRAGDPAGELGVAGRVVAVDPAAEDGDRGPARLERPAMRLGVDAASKPADDDEPGGRELTRPASGRPARRRPSSFARRRSRPPAPSGGRPARLARKSVAGGSCSSREPLRVRRVAPRLRVVIVMPPSRARWASGRRAPRRHARPPVEPAPASAAIVAATRETRACPRAESPTRSTARARSSDAAESSGGRPRASRSRAAATRSRTGLEASPALPATSRRARAGHGHDEIEAVEQRPRELLPVGGEPLRRARALDRRDRRGRRRDRGSSSRRAGSARGR